MAQTYTIVSPSDVNLKPPPGVIPDFQDPFTVRPYWIVTAALGLITSGIFLALRMYTKIMIVKKCRWEDCTFIGHHLDCFPKTYLSQDMCCLGFVSLWCRSHLQRWRCSSNTSDLFRRLDIADFRSRERTGRRSSVESYRQRHGPTMAGT